MEIKTAEDGTQYYEPKHERRSIHIELQSDGVYHSMTCEEIPGLLVAGETMDGLFRSFMGAWRKMKEVAPQQVPAVLGD